MHLNSDYFKQLGFPPRYYYLIQNLLMSLDQATAIRRASIIRHSSIQYNFNIILESDKYHGLAEVSFFIESMNFQQDLQLDFSGKVVQGLIVNNIELQARRSKNFIFLPKSCLQKGKNRISILYQCEYDLDQSGFISFIDNDEQFVFTDFQPYFANRVFPCFDQPDLKAKMKLTVVGPQTWRVLSHDDPITTAQFEEPSFLEQMRQGKFIQYHIQLLVKKNRSNAKTKITYFPQTKLLPSYIFCFAAGNYQQLTNINGTVPMSLYCPPSVVKNLERFSSFIFDITIKCMAFFEEKFKIDYPFTKYDQIFIKQCKFGAMENAGIVTFKESRCLPQEEATQYDYYDLGVIVAHELSHHWFGNYVTMTWWDDLWLNESFAQWISCYSIEKLKGDFDYKFQSSYLYFRDRKNWGYEQDERNSATHPIRGIVRNTFEAASIFDGITYAKGASTLKQLMYLVEQDNFLSALSSYFQRFEWGNATIDDLLEDLSKVFPSKDFSLNDWKRMWLEQPSLNIFQIDWDRVNKQITVNQSSFNGQDTLRYHKVEISLFKADGSFDVLTKQLIKASPATVLTYPFSAQYKAVLLNHNDETFAQNIIDPVSFDFFMRNIDKIKDLFTRMMVWYNIQSMVNIFKIPLLDYVELISNKLFLEPSNFVLEKILKGLRQYLNNFIDQNVGQSFQSIIFRRIYEQLQAVPDVQTERIKILQVQYIEFAHSNSQMEQLSKWLNNNDPNLKNRQMNFNQKWKVVKKIFTLPLSDAQKWDTFNKVKAQDQDVSRINEAETICKVLLANQAEFESVYQEFKSQDVSLTQKYIKIQGWKNAYHSSWIINKYQDRYFTDIFELSQTLGYDEFQFFYIYLAPIDSNLVAQIQNYNIVISQFELIGNLGEHCKNLRKIVDDLTLRMKNIAFNADINTALTRQRAVIRYSYIESGSIDYNYHITFVKNQPYYTGMAEISFALNQVPLILPLECSYQTLYALNVNGVKIDPDTQGQFLYIPRSNLIIGSNFISVHYRNKYNNDGLGCMSFIQTIADPSQYIYTKFQPYGAHRFIPCFDQPDLKAKAAFTVIVPDGWIAVGNQADTYNGAFNLIDYQAKVTSKDKLLLQSYLKDKSGNFFVFPPTKIISTYLYCLVAGEYYELKATDDQLYNKIPMSLFCIKSYSSALDDLGPFIFQMTTLSLKLYEQKFEVPYRFNKYDSVFCHQFKSGAMENPGIITFNDTYLYPQKVSLQKMVQFASTIVHENSHNWFGNFVTMKWWDDLWLNESFADFIAYYCLQNIKDKVTTINKYESGWQFFLIRGVAGYRQDQITTTTHAVRSSVQNTSIATTYFDRITYQKGSATLKQLMFLMGEDNFFKGVRDYFKDFGWKNGTIDDFLGKMQTYFNNPEFTLDDWKQSWLLTPSLNTVEVQWDPKDISDKAILQIKQNYYTPVYPELKYHKTRVAFFYDDASYDVYDVLLTPTAITELTYDGSKQYRAVLVNVDYWDYFKYTIDQDSLFFFETNLNKISNVLTRTIIWHDINQQVRDSKYKIKDFINLFLKYIFQQADDKIFENEFSIIKDVIKSYSPIDQREGLKSQIFEATYNNLKNSPTKNDLENRIKLLKDQLTIFASSVDQIQLLENWRIENNPDLLKYPITVSQAWEVIKLIYCLDDAIYTPQVKFQRYNDQYNKNPGIKGQLTLNTCNTIIADQAELNDVYNSFKQMDLSLDAKLSFAEGWNNLRHISILQNYYKKKYFQDLPILSGQLNSNHFESYYQNLKPIDDDLTETIANYGNVKLEGSDMIGHMKVLTQIKYNYELRQALYQYNA